MKKLILVSGTILLTANILFGTILSFFDNFNVFISSCVIAYTTLLLYLIYRIGLKVAFKESLFILSCIAGVIGYIFSLIAPDQYEDNWWLVLVILLMAFEAILLLVAHTISKKVQ